MACLRRALGSAGLNQVETYIQSGNILFESSQEEEHLEQLIVQTIQAQFNLFIPCVLRTAKELEMLVEGLPFSPEEIAQARVANQEGESLYVAALDRMPAYEDVASLNSLQNPEDHIRLVDRNAYLLIRHSIRHSKLAGSLSRLNVTWTLRNWKTICKLEARTRAHEKSRGLS